jgi:hypothetical protein
VDKAGRKRSTARSRTIGESRRKQTALVSQILMLVHGDRPSAGDIDLCRCARESQTSQERVRWESVNMHELMLWLFPLDCIDFSLRGFGGMMIRPRHRQHRWIFLQLKLT